MRRMRKKTRNPKRRLKMKIIKISPELCTLSCLHKGETFKTQEGEYGMRITNYADWVNLETGDVWSAMTTNFKVYPTILEAKEV
jgi:hypothetical protein